MHRRQRRPRPATPPRQQPVGYRLSAVTFVAGIAAALVMIGAQADEGDAASAGIDSAPVVLSIGR